METVENINNFSTINGSSVRVGHCTKNDNCNISVCIGTDCKGYDSKHPELKG